jgi:hypothetical protein
MFCDRATAAETAVKSASSTSVKYAGGWHRGRVPPTYDVSSSTSSGVSGTCSTSGVSSACTSGTSDMTEYPWKGYSPLRSHDFSEGHSSSPFEPGQLFTCRNCYRGFKYDPRTQKTWAVGRDERCSPLDSSVNRRWLAEDCPGGPSDWDEDDSMRFESLLASG